MTESKRLVQFLAPWQGRSGFKRYSLTAGSSQLKPLKPVKCQKMIRKAAHEIDGLILRPTWPTNNGLCVVMEENDILLRPISGNKIDSRTRAISINDPSFEMKIVERVLYRRFTFEVDGCRLSYRDLAGRLIGPQRFAMEIFPSDDFSPFARLMGILRDPETREKFISDLNRRRFKYSRWVKLVDKPETLVDDALLA